MANIVVDVSRDWSELPTDLLVTILKHLYSVIDYVWFGAVCKSWNSLIKSEPRPPRIPWLMFPAEDDVHAGRDGSRNHRRNFFDMSTGRTCTMPLPELHGRQCIGTSTDGGWVVFIKKDMELGMLNISSPAVAGVQEGRQPLTLPPLATLAHFLGVILDRRGRITKYRVVQSRFPLDPWEVTRSQMFMLFYHKVIVFQYFQVSDDDDDSSGVGGRAAETKARLGAAFIYGPSWTLAVAPVGAKAWTDLHVDHDVITDVVFHRGRRCLYAVNYKGETLAFDLLDASSFTWSGARPLGKYPYGGRFSGFQKYLVLLADDDDDCDGGGGDDAVVKICRRVRFIRDPDADDVTSYGTTAVEAFRLDLSKNDDRWVELDHDLGGYTFFLGYNHSVALPPRGHRFPHVRRDCIYFTDDNIVGMIKRFDLRLTDRNMGVFSLEQGSWEALPLPSAGTMVSSFPSPIWVTI